MTMHVVLGDGEMTRKELTETLADLMGASTQADQSFWFLLQGKSEPTDTDRVLVTWLEKNDVYYEVVTDDPDSMNELYAQPQEVHKAQKIAQKIVGLLQSKPEEGEPAEILALFFDVNDATAAEDRWVNQVIQVAADAGFPCRALNDGLVEVDLSEQAAEAEAEPTKAAPAKKSTAKSTAKKAAAVTPVSEEDESDAASAGPSNAIPTREELEDMEPTEVKKVAASLGIELPPRTHASTYIDHILGEAKSAAPQVAVEELPEDEETEIGALSINGFDPQALAEMVADLVWERIRKAFVS